MSSSEDMLPEEPPRNRRRSSLVPRKSLAPAAPPILRTEVALRQYIAEATSEKQDWLNLARERRAKSKELEETLNTVKENAPTLSYKDVEEFLTDNDKKFISEQPDYEKLFADSTALVEEVAIVKNRLEKLGSQMQLIGLLAQARLDTISSALCSYNEQEPSWMPASKQ